MEEKEKVRCVYCGRILKDAISIRRKCGPSCLKKLEPKKKNLLDSK